MSHQEILQQIPTFQTNDYGPLAAWSDFLMAHPRLGPVAGKQFLRQTLGLTSMEISLNSLAPGKAVPFVHGHRQNEELYLFLAGTGEFLLDGTVVALHEGTAVRVAPSVLRCWRNTGTEPLIFIVIQAKADSLTQASASDGFISSEPAVWSAP